MKIETFGHQFRPTQWALIISALRAQGSPEALEMVAELEQQIVDIDRTETAFRAALAAVPARQRRKNV